MDHGFFPYGNKSREFLFKRTLFLSNYLFNQNCDYVILACNTLSVIVLPFLKQFYQNKIIGIFDIIKKSITDSSLLIGSNQLINELKGKECKFKMIATQDLIEKIEDGKIEKEDIKNFESTISPSINRLVLGCSHFLAIEDLFSKKYELISQRNYIKSINDLI